MARCGMPGAMVQKQLRRGLRAKDKIAVTPNNWSKGVLAGNCCYGIYGVYWFRPRFVDYVYVPDRYCEMAPEKEIGFTRSNIFSKANK